MSTLGRPAYDREQSTVMGQDRHQASARNQGPKVGYEEVPASVAAPVADAIGNADFHPSVLKHPVGEEVVEGVLTYVAVGHFKCLSYSDEEDVIIYAFG